MRPTATLRTVLLASLLLLGLFVVLGCRASAPPPATPAPPTAVEVLVAAASRAEQAQRFHFLLEHERGATTIVRGIQMTRAEGDVDGPDRVQATVKGMFSGLNFELGLVILGPDAWIQNPLTRRWEPEAITVRQFFDAQRGVVAVLRKVREPRLVGVEDVGGVRAYHLDAILDAADLTLLPGTTVAGRQLAASAWVAVDGSAVLRIELRGASAQGDPDDLLRRLTLTRHGESVRIEPPR